MAIKDEVITRQGDVKHETDKEPLANSEKGEPTSTSDDADRIEYDSQSTLWKFDNMRITASLAVDTLSYDSPFKVIFNYYVEILRFGI